MATTVSRPHLRRLRELWRSAGWPCHDGTEAELLAAGLLQREHDAAGRERLRVTEAGVAAIAAGLQRNRGAFDAHEALVQRVAREMQRGGRIAYTGLKLRAQVPQDDGTPRWVQARPDVFSIRRTSVEAYLQPLVHEIKVRRADLLSDLRQPAKRAAYLGMASECWYVLAEGIGEPEEVPPECGVLIARAGALDCARAAPPRATAMRFDVWMALAQAVPLEREEPPQGLLGEAQAD